MRPQRPAQRQRTTALRAGVLFGLAACLRAALCADVAIDPSATADSVKVPPGFLGLSLEPVNQTFYMAGDAVFTELLRNLLAYSTGSINLRLGGVTQDRPSPDALLNAPDAAGMIKLRNELQGLVTYTIPINLRTGTPELAVRQLQVLKDSQVPPEAIYALAIGNEPNLYKDKPAGWFPGGGYYATVAGVMKAVQPLLADWGASTRLLSGPGLTYPLHTYPVSRVPEFAKLGQGAPGGPFAKVLAVHYYATSASAKKNTNLKYLLWDKQNVKFRAALREYARAARAAGLVLRIDETNNIAQSGTFGVSNTLGSALWLVIHALGVMQTGVDGINVHGAGCTPYSPVLFPGACQFAVLHQKDQIPKFRAMCPQANVCPSEAGPRGSDAQPAVANAPYFGMLFVQRLLRNHDTLTLLGPGAVRVSGGPEDSVMVYALRAPGELRVVLVHKRGKPEGPLTAQVTISGPNDWGVASVERLVADGLTSTAPGITVAGYTVDAATGRLRQAAGVQASCKVKPTLQAQATVYSVVLPPASATVLLLPHRSALGARFDDLLRQELSAADRCPS